ncbi:signal peptidase I [Paenibacillus sp. IB182496]|uniref:Signal peptidase I n=1 Tax=Paenibacillus sabuli TaxID=2772509 RepID=A0A927GSW9_9BACL|nr:signal peptidase I [Paenibacillus sabuli]MBD2846107.1 signal peptidase I [Paenibacillus sabuli]
MEQKPGEGLPDEEMEPGVREQPQSEAQRGTGEAEASEPASGRKSNARKELLEWIKALAIAAVLVFVIRMFLFSPFIVDGPSMEPNFVTGERVIVNKILYDIRAPQRGEVVVFHVPEEGRDFIKRVIAVPGDKVKLEGDRLYINGSQVEEPYLKEAIEAAQSNDGVYNTGANFPNGNVQTDIVPEGMILAFGDNRGNSKDSRTIGYVSQDEVIGRADLIFWPLGKIQLVNHR